MLNKIKKINLLRMMPYLSFSFAMIIAIIIANLPIEKPLLPVGQNMLAILAFSVIIWITGAIDYTSSAIIISALMVFVLGFSPSIDNPDIVLGTINALKVVLSGFANPALALVSAAMFISTAMTITGLDKRIAFFTISHISLSNRGILFATLLITVLLSLFIPSATARSACIVTIMMGIINSLKISQKSSLAASIMIMIAQATSVWNVGIQTSAAQNLLSMSLIQKIFNTKSSISWLDWLLAGAPWSIVMSFVLYFLILKFLPVKNTQIQGNFNTIKKTFLCHSITNQEKKLITIFLVLLFFWITGEKLHSIDTTSVTLIGLAIMLLPGIGVITWKDLEKRIQWGTLLTFGVGISLGSALIYTEAASWLAHYVVQIFYLEKLSSFCIFAVLSAFLIIIHLGFSSASALTSALIPILINILTHLPSGSNINLIGMSIILTFSISFGFILPINSPQNMICLGTNTFTPSQFTKISIWLTIIGYAMLLFFALTWWHFLGLI